VQLRFSYEKIDALCAAPLSQKYNCPILLNIKENLLSSTKKEIQRLEAKNAVIIGGTGAISENVEKELKAIGLSCTRISGEDRFDTSVKIAEKLDFNGEVCVATGLNFPDAISISSIATQKGMPVLLTMTYKCPQSVKDYIKNKNITAAYIVGSDDVVSDGVAGNFPHVKRLQGNDRYDTNMAVISNFAKELKLSTVYVATGSNYPDALAASALAAKTHSPVFLVNDTAVDKTKEYLLQNQILPNVVAIGQTDVVSDGVVKELLQNTGNTNGNLQLNKPGIDENYTVIF
jgi:N-acetylmuramoyl-L-alanine amidase